jgi:hypothetical protein
MPHTKDLVVLTADKDAHLGIQTLLDRHGDLGFRPLTFECWPHPKHDSGVLVGAHHFLRSFLRQAEYALVVFDLEGCGQEKLGREGAERKVHENLTANGWEDRCEVVAIEPELECWVWDDSLRVSRILGWDRQYLKDWLLHEEFLASATAVKPARPKEAFRAAMRAAKRQMSSSVFQDLAKSANVAGCTDAAFLKFLGTLRAWFPASRKQQFQILAP